MNIKLSIIVIGRNEGERLTKCFEAVKKMQVPSGNTELIYVDSASTDDSIQRAKVFGAKIIKLQRNPPTAAAARNAGWHQSQGEFILFLDGDTVMQPDFINDALSLFSDPQVAVVTGHRREMFPNKSVYHRVTDLDWIYPPGFDTYCGGDAIIRKSILDDVGGYDAALIAGEEPDLCRRIREKGYTIKYLDTLMTLHDLNMTTFGQYWKRAYRSGHAYAELAKRYRKSNDPLWSQESQHNFLKIGILVILFTVTLIFSYLYYSFFPLLALCGIFSLLIVRTAIKTRKKSNNWMTLFLYGLHSHIQHIPIFFGQLAFFFKNSK